MSVNDMKSFVDPSAENKNFWSEPCGTQMLRSMGLTDYSPESIQKFDTAFFEYYPYLDSFVPESIIAGKDVIEVGLGMGSVGRRIDLSARSYTGVDIAQGPVDLINNSVVHKESSRALCASVLKLPLQSETFDLAVSIGCLHHTGSITKSATELSRVLKPNGRLRIMIYNKYSGRRLWRYPAATFLEFCMGLIGRTAETNSQGIERAAYDISSAGAAAPYTSFLSAGEIRSVLKKAGFSNIRIERRNMDPAFFLGKEVSRKQMRRIFESFFGLDLYISAVRS